VEPLQEGSDLGVGGRLEGMKHGAASVVARVYTPSSTKAWKWRFRFRAEPKHQTH
jgi:hypothetical protein